MKKPQTLNARGLIAAAVAVASGSALAEQAGRVSFVTGDVRATASDGSTRSLARGDIINTGDKISTGAGRLQLRFTDGGFVSLQPNTVFGVDQYLYANKPPEETSLFFSLLQGGMRTVTGAIGKVNKQSYKVRTPVATIGIRGTGYRARVDAKRMVVSVGSGFVNVENKHGNITAGAGQNIEATLTSGPRMTNTEPDVNASGPEGEREQYVASDSEDARQQRLGDQINVSGNNLILANGEPPVYTYEEEASGNVMPNGSGYSLTTTGSSGGVTTISGLTATFDPNTGAITSLVQPSSENPPPSGLLVGALLDPVATGPSFSPGTLQFTNIKRFGNIGFGEITNGSTEDNSLGIFPSSVAAGEFYGYMMAVPSNIGFTGGKASYSLQGGSLARLNRGETTGELAHFNFNVNLLSGLADVDMMVKMSAASGLGDISVSGNDLSLGNPLGSTFFFGEGLTTSSTGTFCASGCISEISGLFVGGGTQTAASYSIRDNLSSDEIAGYAALGLSAFAPQQDAMTILTLEDGIYSNASLIQNAAGHLVNFAADVCSDGCISYFDSGDLNFINTGRSGSIYWGEYTDGEGRYAGGYSGFNANLGSDQFQAYILGPQVTPSFSGTAKYSLVSNSGTPARLNGGSTTGTLNKLDLTLNLGTALAGIDMMLSIAGDTLAASASNLSLNSFDNGSSFGINGIATSSQGTFCSGSCYTDISGFFSGTNGNQLGVGYSINGSGGIIKGTTALAQNGAIEPDPVLDDGYTLLTQDSGEGGAYAGTVSAIFNSDFTIAELSDSGNCEGPCSFETGTLQTISQGQTSNLRWGELTDGTATYGNMYGLPQTVFGGTGTLGSNEFVSYIIGKTLSVDGIQGAATASYSMQGGRTPVRYAYEGIGGPAATLSQFDMTFNLFAGTVDVDMLVSGVDNGVGNIETVTVTGRNIFLPMISVDLDESGNLIDSYGGAFSLGGAGLITSSSENIFCEIGCNTSIFGFLAGNSSEIGTSYAIYGRGYLKGVAALGLSSTPLVGDNLPLKDGAGYILVADRGQNVILSNGNPYTGEVGEASFDASGNLLNFNTIYAGEGSNMRLDSGTASHVSAESGTYRTLHWGRLNGTGADVTYNGEVGVLGDSQSATPGNIHYVVGTITDPNEWRSLNQGYTGGTATYSVVGQTNPTNTAGTAGTLNSALLTLHLDSYQPQLDVELDVSMGTDNYVAKSTGNYLSYLGCGPAAATFNTSSFNTTVNGGACGGSGCNTSVHGFFSGSQAQQAGMSYSIVDTGTANTTITGAAALTMNTLSID